MKSFGPAADLGTAKIVIELDPPTVTGAALQRYRLDVERHAGDAVVDFARLCLGNDRHFPSEQTVAEDNDCAQETAGSAGIAVAEA